MTNSSDGPSQAAHRDSVSGTDAALPAPPPLSVSYAIALFLDFDGTLVEIADRPDEVLVDARLADLLAQLSDHLAGRIAIITGRSIAALETLIGPVEIAIAGSHGGEFRATGKGEIEPLALPFPPPALAELSRCASRNGGLLVEPKPFSAAVHYRHHPEALENLLECTENLASEFGLVLKHGKQVIELTMPGSDKGSAVSRFMGLEAFTDATPIFVGDDVTDEDAFSAVRTLGGHGILVGAQRPTAAAYRLEGVADVHGWLQSGLKAAQKGDFRT